MWHVGRHSITNRELLGRLGLQAIGHIPCAAAAAVAGACVADDVVAAAKEAAHCVGAWVPVVGGGEVSGWEGVSSLGARASRRPAPQADPSRLRVAGGGQLAISAAALPSEGRSPSTGRVCDKARQGGIGSPALRATPGPRKAPQSAGNPTQKPSHASALAYLGISFDQAENAQCLDKSAT
jgi:hypothetical protein